jgi:hypothetical protein
MNGARVNKIGKSELFDIPETLKIWMRDNVIDQITLDRYKSIDGVVNDLLFIKASAVND